MLRSTSPHRRNWGRCVHRYHDNRRHCWLGIIHETFNQWSRGTNGHVSDWISLGLRCVYPYLYRELTIRARMRTSHTHTIHLSHNAHNTTTHNIPPTHITQHNHTTHNHTHHTSHITQPHITQHTTTHHTTHNHTHHTTTHNTQPHMSHNTITHHNHHRRLTWSMLMPVRKRRSGPWSNSLARDLTLHSTPWDSSCVLASFLWITPPLSLSPFSSLLSFSRYAKVAPQSAGGIPLGLLKNAPPPSYTCFRCGQRGHWIKLCPTNGVRSNLASFPGIALVPGSFQAFQCHVFMLVTKLWNQPFKSVYWLVSLIGCFDLVSLGSLIGQFDLSVMQIYVILVAAALFGSFVHRILCTTIIVTSVPLEHRPVKLCPYPPACQEPCWIAMVTWWYALLTSKYPQ